MCQELTGLDDNQASREHDALFPHLKNHAKKMSSSGFNGEGLPLCTGQLNSALDALHFRA
jgi:hypothetical protein